VAILGVVAIGVAIAFSGSDDPAARDDSPSYGPVSIEGSPLPAFESPSDDPAVGQTIPRVEGTAPDGSVVTIKASGQPTVVAFLAHWCPHCQREVPVLVDLMKRGDLEGVRMIGVLTSTSPDQPNFPPVAWLEREGWSSEVLLDDDQSSALASYGRGGFPFLVFVDGDGKVVARTSGEQPANTILSLIDSAR
jgi:thiol-disulfide isomerase/thioredoxin